MNRHMGTKALLVAAIAAVALGTSTGIAHADSDGLGTPTPGIVDFLLTNTPALFADPADEGGRTQDWGGVGMYCENLMVHCR